MNLNGYLLCNNTSNEFDSVVKRVKEMGIGYYNYRKYLPVYIINYNNKPCVYFETQKDLELPMYLLGYSFEGLIDDDERINEIECFGKYRCQIIRVDNVEYNGILNDIF